MWFRSIFNGKSRPPAHSPGVEQPASVGLSARALRQLNQFYLDTGMLSLDQPVGGRSSQMRRPATDFREHRQYAPGDDVRFVDWKASARQEHIFIKQGDMHKAATVYLLVDCSASMAWGEPPKSLAALQLALALGYLAVAHQDRLVIYPITGDQALESIRPIGPLSGKGQAPQLPQVFQGLRFHGQIDLPLALSRLSRIGQSRGGLVLVISDLLGVDAVNLRAGLEALPAPRWKVVICQMLHPAEMDPGLEGALELQDVETGQKKRATITPQSLVTYRKRLQSWQADLAQVCLERRAIYNLLPTNWALENEMILQLRRARVVRSQ